MNENITKDKELNAITDEVVEVEVIAKVTKEEKEALINASSHKKIVSYLVDQYYQSQSYRITADNQARAVLQGFDESDREQFIFIEKERNNAKAQEALNKKYMDIVTDTIPVCRWMKSITGIGPVLSAYLYSAFDVKVGKYNTNFLSYAGLNDNNNPWLGTEKAKALVKEALEYRKEKYNCMNDVLRNACIDDKEYNKLIKLLTKIGKTDEELIFEDIQATILSELCIDIDSIVDLDLSIFFDFIRVLAFPKFCDDMIIDYVASKTTRNPSNVSKGTKNNWEKKKTKSKFPTVDDLESYLAKPPYNKDLKKMMYLVGDMFIKNSGREKSLYGKIYKQKKLEYTRKNENGEYAEEAARILAEKHWDTSTPTYKRLSQGMLSDAHILARARRYAVKLFISHVFEAMYYAEYREEPPKTYVIQYMGHHDYIGPEVDYRPFIDGKK